ncbi:MAG: flippase-like domain-containing protein [Proteobacteria bacterium]|nr:flippase-like domain-containing protein [Pseudomonadota bacterium]
MAEPRKGTARRPVRRFTGLALRLLITTGALGYLLTIVEPAQLLGALGRVSAWAVVLGIALYLLALALAAVRWSLILRAYGAGNPPRLRRLLHLHLVGMFYNLLPGAVAGDLLRALGTRQAFSERGLTGALAVVFVDRVFGLAGLILLAASVFYLNPLPGVEGIWLWSALGLTAGIGVILAIGLGRRLAEWLPGGLSRWAAGLPAIKLFWPFMLAAPFAMATHTLVAVSGHVLVTALDATVTPMDSLVVVPLAAAATYFPLTVGGAGAVEGAMVFLYGRVGVAEANALATGILLQLAKLVTSGVGGLAGVVWPLGIDIKDALARKSDPQMPTALEGGGKTNR